MTWSTRLVGLLLMLALLGLLSASGCGPKATESVRLGAVLPLTGDVASYGLSAKNGIELAIDELNVAGGIGTRQVVVDFQDDRGEAKTAVAIMKQFATVHRYPVVFGSAGSSVTLAIAPIANRNSVVLVSPISSSTKLSTEGGRFFFRTCPGDDLQAEVLSRWLAEDERRRVAVVYTNNAWGQPLADGFKAKFEAAGGTVALMEGIPENTTDFRTIIAKIKSDTAIEAVVSPTYPKEGGVFVRQCKELGLDLPLYGGDNWGSPEFRQIAGTAAEGVLYTAPSEIRTRRYEEFAGNFKAKFGKKPDVFAAYAYDAAQAAVRAMQSAEELSGEAVRKALAGVSFEGVSGRIRFRGNGDIDSEAFARMRVRRGEPEPVV